MLRSLLFAVALAAPILSAQQPANPQPTPPTPPVASVIRIDGQAFILPAGTIELTDLIGAAARFLHRNLLFLEVEVLAAGPDSRITLQQEVVVDARGCEELLGSLLYLKGFAVVPLDAEKALYEVISMYGPRGREISNRAVSRTVAEVMARPNLKQYVVVTVPLQYINATVATAALRPFFASSNAGGSGGLCLGNVGNNTAMLVSGFTDQVVAAIRLLQECDKAATEPAQPPPVLERLARVEAALARLQAQLDGLLKGK